MPPEFVIVVIRKVVPHKSGAWTIDCAMNYCVLSRGTTCLDKGNVSFERGYPHIFHEIVDLSVHCMLPAYKHRAFYMLSVSVSVYYVAVRTIVLSRHAVASNSDYSLHAPPELYGVCNTRQVILI